MHQKQILDNNSGFVSPEKNLIDLNPYNLEGKITRKSKINFKAKAIAFLYTLNCLSKGRKINQKLKLQFHIWEHLF